ncbi:MAG: hypothetical protein JNK82_16770 [Myxococcaceae bacterium]|nr:hypothetical protein [Myxococcaceae bacterium]
MKNRPAQRTPTGPAHAVSRGSVCTEAELSLLIPAAQQEPQMTFRTALVASLVTLVSACNAPGSLRTSDGKTIPVESAAFVPTLDQSGQMVSATIFIADEPDVCRTLRAGRSPKKVEGLMLTVLSVSDRAVLAPDVGEYTVITNTPQRAGSYAAGTLFKTDLNCNNTIPDSDALLKSGFITIDKLETGRQGFASGTIDATYGRGEDIIGRFSAEYCEVTNTNFNCQ